MKKKLVQVFSASIIAATVALILTILAPDPLYRILCYNFYDLCVYPGNVLIFIIYYLLFFITWLVYIFALKFIARDRTYVAIFAASASLLAEYIVTQLEIISFDNWLLYATSALISAALLIFHDSLLNFLATKKAWYPTIVGALLIAVYGLLIWIVVPRL